MKHKKIKSLVATGMILPAMLVAGCSCDHPLTFARTVYIKAGEGDFSESYKTKHKINSDSKTIGYMTTDLTDYDDFIKNDTIPSASEMIAPEGKVFGGWFLDSELTTKNHVNRETLGPLILDYKNESSINLYPKWINKSYATTIFYLNVNNDEMNYSQEFITANSSELTNKIITKEILDNKLTSNESIKQILDTLPEYKDFNPGEYKYSFGGWYLDYTLTTPASEENILAQHAAGIRCFDLHAKWNMYPVLNILNETLSHFSESDSRILPEEAKFNPMFELKNPTSDPIKHPFNAKVEDIIASLPKKEEYKPYQEGTLNVNEYNLEWYIEVENNIYHEVTSTTIPEDWSNPIPHEGENKSAHYYVEVTDEIGTHWELTSSDIRDWSSTKKYAKVYSDETTCTIKKLTTKTLQEALHTTNRVSGDKGPNKPADADYYILHLYSVWFKI